jgi:gluconate 2-dehydrogenase
MSMVKPKVLIAKKIPKDVEEYIAKHCDYEIWSDDKKANYNTIIDKIHDVEGILMPPIRVDENFLEHAPKLKIISNVSVGYNNFDIEAMKKRNIIGTNTPEVLNNTVADLIFGLIIASARRISELDRYVKEGNWEKGDDEIFFGKDIYKSSLGIIGMGRIGQCVAKRAKLGFDMDVYYHNRNKRYDIEDSLGARYLELDSLLGTCDFVVLMTPLTDETYHLMDDDKFSKMKKDAIFINASRGKTVDEDALIRALQNNKILAAGLDVYEQEPVSSHSPLLKMKNVITLPHIASSTEKTRNKMAMAAAQNLVQGICGEMPKDVVPELRD